MSSFDLNCRRCDRLAHFLDDVKAEHPDYFAKPVPPFGAKKAQLLIVGLAPGMHGANRTGRPFTGDHAGILLYQTLYKYGFASKPESISADDNLKLKNCRITNAVKCLPPQNKPLGSEVNQCTIYLTEELQGLRKGSVILALGSLAHNAILKALGLKLSTMKFGHNVEHALDNGCILLDSYHCSRYNTQTKRLTEKMFCEVFARAKKILSK
ncbi:MAG TPA: uracil-DNA glycosylase [Gammaproteobacteria bacterium]|nr:uracil-DNA glycosylase [Gammaproteobacteria bacterium]